MSDTLSWKQSDRSPGIEKFMTLKLSYPALASWLMLLVGKKNEFSVLYSLSDVGVHNVELLQF